MTDPVAEMKARARELLKCLRCAGSGNVMHYGNNYGRCIKCDGRGYDEELAVEVAAFAAKEVEAERLENAKAQCWLCKEIEKWKPAEKSGNKWRHWPVNPVYEGPDGVSFECGAAPIWERAHGKKL